MGHLSDSAFATLVKDETKSGSPAISAEEVAKVKADWEEKQKKKEEKDKNKDKEKEKEKNKEEEKEKSKDKEKKEEPASSTTSAKNPSTPAHERYILHRDFFAS